MKCPYQIKIDCHYVNISGMTKEKECGNCEYYDNGIRPTGAILHFKPKRLTDWQVKKYCKLIVLLIIVILCLYLFIN